jgi:cytochrome c553
VAGGPRIQFDRDEFDFGVLPQGATVQYRFDFRNGGSTPLNLGEVVTSCGCTAALATDKVVPPGGKSAVTVTFDSRGKMGDVVKVVRVSSDDARKPVYLLTMKGVVMASAHPEMTGPQNLFAGDCRRCHADRGQGKMGAELYAADCAMCHENHTRGGGHKIAPSAGEMAALPPAALKALIAEGRGNSSMPGFAEGRGGPLTPKQIKSLVKFLHRRQP